MLHVKKAVKQSCTDERSAWDVPVNPPGWKSARTSAFKPRLVSCVCKAEPPISGDGECWSSKREMVTLKGKQNAETAGVVPDSPTGAGGSHGQVPLSSTSLGDQKFPKAICSHRVSALWICFLLHHQSAVCRPVLLARSLFPHPVCLPFVFAAALIFNFQIIFVSVWDNITKDMMWILNIFGALLRTVTECQRSYQDHFGTVLSPINHCFVADYIYLNT